MNNKHIGLSYVITYLLTYLPTPWSRVLLEKLASSQLVKKFRVLCGTRRFICTFTSARLFTYLLTPWSRVLLEKLISSQVVKKFPVLCGTRRFISAFTSARLLTYVHTYSMEQSPTWEANQFSSSQEIPCVLSNPKIHFRIYKCPPPVPILR